MDYFTFKCVSTCLLLTVIVWLSLSSDVVERFRAGSNKKKENISLSPADWPEGEFEKFERLSLGPAGPKPLVFSFGKGMVSGTTSPFAVHSGLVALRKGGNAMDACIATAIAQVALVSGAYVSYAGVTNIVYYDSNTSQVYHMDGAWNVPKKMDTSKIPPVHTLEPNGASVLVPGFIAGIAEAADRFASFSLSTLLQPALYFAEKGFKMPPLLAYLIKANYNKEILLRTAEGKEIFTNPKTDQPYKYLELFKQPKLAEFLRNISRFGKDYFYRGWWAEKAAAEIQLNKGFITMEDFSKYKAKWRQPANTTYKQYIVQTIGTQWGGPELVEKVNLIELAGIGGGNQSYLTNSSALFWLASINRFSAFVSSFIHFGSDGISKLKAALGLDLSNRCAKSSAEAIWDKIGTVEKMKIMNGKIRKLLGGGTSKTAVDHHSDGVVTVDKDGNVCSMVHTINSLPWGTGLFVQGNALSNFGSIYKAAVNLTNPGERLPDAQQPIIVFKKHRRSLSTSSDEVVTSQPVLALSVVGSSLSFVTTQRFTAMLDSKMNPKQAIEAPTFYLPSPSSFQQDIRVEKNKFSKRLLNEVRAMGQQITEVDDHEMRAIFSPDVAITIDKGHMYGCSNPITNGLAEGVKK